MRLVGGVGGALVAAMVAASCGGDDSSATTATDDGGVHGDGAVGDGTTGGDGAIGDGATGDGATRDGSTSDANGSCLGASFLASLGRSKMIVGATMADATASAAPFDHRYIYVSGGVPDGTGPCASCASGCATKGTTCANSGPGCAWWGCWQYDQDPPGAYVRSFDAKCAGATPPQIPMVTYYMILQASGVSEGAPEVTQAATNATFMARYFADYRFLLQQIGQTTALLHIEPDFWGYAQQHGSDPTAMAAAVASANATDCSSLPNTIAGLGKCFVAMTRKYAPNAKVALHASAWSTNMDVAMNTNPALDIAGEARKTAAFLSACGEVDADYIVVETSDRDAGYYETVQHRAAWWDATNTTLPTFHQDFAWVKALTEALGKPALYWQTPLGNASQNDTTNHYKDNRVDYFFAHMSELAGAHAVGVAFGAGAGDQTTPESDGGNFVSKAKAYYTAGGQTLCP